MFDLENFLTQHSFVTYWLAYSGGVDSHVLLHLFAQKKKSRPELSIKVIHINHQISPHAAAWADHCAHICAEYNLPLKVIKISGIAPPGESPEDFARLQRYAAFEKIVQDQEVLITAHHEDDQAETLLLQLMRGAGPKGLSAMPQLKKFGQGFHGRPFLNVSGAVIRSYAQSEKLQWIEDESNANEKFQRNFIRHQLLPLLQKKWPRVQKTLVRSATNCQEANALLEEIAAQDLARCVLEPHSLSIPQLCTLSTLRRRNLLRYWLQQQNFSLPSRVKLTQIEEEVLGAKPDRNPVVTWPGVQIRRFQQKLMLIPGPEVTSPKLSPSVMSAQAGIQSEMIAHNRVDRSVLASLNNRSTGWNLNDKNYFPLDSGFLTAQRVQGQGILLPEQARVQIGFRLGGEKIVLPQRGTKSLKKLFQEWQIPTWERGQVPLIYWENQLVQIANFAIAKGFQVPGKEVWGWEIVWNSGKLNSRRFT